MLSAQQIQNLKRTNVSKSAERTRQRFEEIFKPAKIKEKQAIRALAGVTSQVAHNTYSTGNISIKMVIAVSQVLNVNPFYLTGEADEPGEFSDEALRGLLLKHNYRDLIASIELAEKKKQPDTRQTTPEEPAIEAVAEEILVEKSCRRERSKCADFSAG